MSNFWERLLLKKDGELCAVLSGGELKIATHFFPSNSQGQDLSAADQDKMPSAVTVTCSGFVGNCAEMNGVHSLSKVEGFPDSYLYTDASGWFISIGVPSYSGAVWTLDARRSWNPSGTWWKVANYTRYAYFDDGQPTNPLTRHPMPRPPSGPWIAGFDYPPMDIAFSPGTVCRMACEPGAPTGPTEVDCDGVGVMTVSYP